MGNLWRYEPVILAWVLNGGLAVLLGNLIHISSTQEAAVTTIATALVTIFTALKTHPPAVSMLVGAVTTMAVAAGAFGLHLSAAEIGAGAAILSGILGLVLRANVSPKAPPA
jgi:hypothetical protein